MNSFRNIVLVAAYGAMLLMVPTASAAFKHLHEGMEIPHFNGTDVRQGAEIATDKMIEDGSVVVILFWATWSERSLEQLHDMESLFDSYQGQPIHFLAINVEGQQISNIDRTKIMGIVDSLPPGMPVIIDEGLDIFYQFGVIAVPSTAVLDSTGSLRYGPAGYSLKTRDLIVDSIEVLLGLRMASADSAITEGYRPKPTASRYYRLAQKLHSQRMYERALENVQQAIDTDSGFAAPYCLRGEVYLMLDSLTLAEQSYQLALLHDSTSIVGLTGLGESLRRSGNLDSAQAVLGYGLAVDSTYTPCVLSLALCLSSSGDNEGASELLEIAHSLNPNDAMVLYYRAQVAREAGNLNLSVTSYLRALEILYPSPEF